LPLRPEGGSVSVIGAPTVESVSAFRNDTGQRLSILELRVFGLHGCLESGTWNLKLPRFGMCVAGLWDESGEVEMSWLNGWARPNVGRSEPLKLILTADPGRPLSRNSPHGFRNIDAGVRMSNQEKNLARRHHILPRLLLKRFSEGDKVWVLDRTNRKSYRTNTVNAACETDYYSVETTGGIPPDCIEQQVLGIVEGRAEPIIQNILVQRTFPKCGSKDWAALVEFLALMYSRGPTLRTMLQSVYKLGAQATSEFLHADEERWNSIMRRCCEQTGTHLNLRYEDALHARDTLEITVDIPTTHHVQFMLELVMILTPIFSEMTMNLEITDVASDAEYVVSDCPILPTARSPNHVSNWRWPHNPDADIFFPMSAKACLVLNYDALQKVTPVAKQRVAFVNHVAACNSERVIISRKRDFVWRRENGTTSASHEELLQFLSEFTDAPSEMRVDKNQLQAKLSAAFEDYENETL